MTPNLSPSSLRLSAEALRLYATPPEDVESIPPILLESRRAVMSEIAGELEALARPATPALVALVVAAPTPGAGMELLTGAALVASLVGVTNRRAV